MARYETTITSPNSPEQVFDYLSDFSSAAQWDPGVVRARVLDGEPGNVGAEFEIVSRFLGREVPLTYRTLEAVRPTRVLLKAENATVVSLDAIEMQPLSNGGTSVTYTANLRLRGPMRLLDPLLGLVFNRIGDHARDGLAANLGRPMQKGAGVAAA